MAQALIVRVDLRTDRPILRCVGGQPAAHWIDAERKELIECSVECGQIKMAAAQEVPIKRFQMAGVKHNPVPLANGAIVKRLGTHYPEQLVGPRSRRGESMQKRWSAYRGDCGSHITLPVI